MSQTQTVLMVDDSIPLHALVRTQLEPHALKLHSAFDGESALSMAAAIHPSLILLDVNLPRLDGFEVCRSLKANPATAMVPLIFLTADSVLTNKVKGLEMGAADYITKPFKPEELQARVRLALRAKHGVDAMTMVDAATGLWNRAYLNAHLPVQLSMAKRSARPLACIVSDIDPLCAIRAKHGEAAANQVLHYVGDILRSQCRAEDILCRMEGGEFAMLLSGTNSASAAQIAERLRGDVQRRLCSCGGIEMHITCSFGVADTLDGSDGFLIDRANAAAHRARQLGRNCVSMARQPTEKQSAAA
jgi:two-component system, cell cycle response regulator